MTVIELIDLLSELNPESQVRIAQQPNWPLEYYISNVVEVDLGGKQGTVAYIGEGNQLGYLPAKAKEELSW